MTGFTLTLRGVTEAPREYACDAHGPFELVVDLATSSTPRPCPTCAAPSERTLTASIATRMAVSIESGRGKSDGPPNPLAMDTRGLAEGKVSMQEFKAQRRALHRDNRRARAKQRGVLR